MSKIRDVVEFNRPKKYRKVRVLGSGACGETVHVYDEEMGFDLVVKKYTPIVAKESQPELFMELLRRFKGEARILFRLNHPHIVRVFSFFNCMEFDTAFIIMELINGTDILSFVREHPSEASSLFERVLEGFSHLEANGILHRDIRPHNILVTDDGVPKIIDFGFGKEVQALESAGKSISLNWWCETPPEFADGLYDLQTEVYFVGKLFERAILESELRDFKYRGMISKMTALDRDDRMRSFSGIQQEIARGRFNDVAFSPEDVRIYRQFVGYLVQVFSSIEGQSKYEDSPEKIVHGLERLHRNTLLEECVPEPNALARIFVLGSFRYFTGTEIPPGIIAEFAGLLRKLSPEKREIVLANLFGRLGAVKRTYEADGDEIPF